MEKNVFHKQLQIIADQQAKHHEMLAKIENNQQQTQKEILTFEDAVKFTGLSRSYLYKLTSKGMVPCFKPQGKLIFFERESLIKWCLQNPVKSADQIERDASSYVTLKKSGRAGK